MQFYQYYHRCTGKKTKKTSFIFFPCIHHAPSLCLTNISELEMAQNTLFSVLISRCGLSHAKRWNGTRKREEKQKRKFRKPVFFYRKLIKILITLLMLFFFLFSLSVTLLLGNPTRCRQLFTPGRTAGEEGWCVKRENLTRRTTERHSRHPYL